MKRRPSRGTTTFTNKSPSKDAKVTFTVKRPMTALVWASGQEILPGTFLCLTGLPTLLILDRWYWMKEWRSTMVKGKRRLKSSQMLMKVTLGEVNNMILW